MDVRQLDVGPWKLDVGLWAVDIWTLGVGRGRSYVFSWMLSAARSTRWTMDVGSWTLEVGRWTCWTRWTRWTLGHSDTLDVGLDVERERDVGLWMFDSARCTLHVVRPYVGRCGLDGRHWLLGCWMLDVVDWTLDIGCWDVGCWTLDRTDVQQLDVRMLDIGRRTSNVGR